MHDDHFHCISFPPGATPGPNGSAVRTDTWARFYKNIRLPGVPLPISLPDPEFYSLTDDLAALAKTQNAKLPGSAKLESLGKTNSGSDLWLLKLGKDLAAGAPQPRMLFTAGLHAREWLAPTYTYLIAEWLVTNYAAAGGGPLADIARDLLENNQIWFVPMCNPDGHEYSVTTYRWQRKNSPSGDKHFRTAPGDKPGRVAGAPESVDLNRNFATKEWKAVVDSGAGNFDSGPDEDGYVGKTPGSATEVKMLQKLIDATEFDVAVDHHTFDCALMYPYGDALKPAKQDARLTTFAGLMQQQLNAKAALAKNRTTRPDTADTWNLTKISNYYLGVYKAAGQPLPSAVYSRIPGSITDYIIYGSEKADRKRKTLAFAMELPPMHYKGSPGFAPLESVIQPTFRQLIGTSLALIKNAGKDTPAAADFKPFDKVAP
jgi:hypothetical protein